MLAEPVQYLRLLSLWVLLCLILASPASASKEIDLSRSKLVLLTLHLEVAEPELKYDFAQIALAEMYHSYQDELKKSLENLPQDAKKRAKIRGWRYATQTYLESLEQLFLLMDSQMPVDFFITPQNKITLLIAAQPVIISGPNSGANKRIENNIVKQFCQLYDCREYFQESTLPDRQNKQNSAVKEVVPATGSWSIKRNLQAEFITSNGIVFQFNDIKNRQQKQRWALAVIDQLNRLINNLTTVQAKGNSIQWSALAIGPLPVTDNAHKITINDDGDFIKISLPLLAAHPSLLKQLQPWLKNHFDNQQISRIIVENADTYFQL